MSLEKPIGPEAILEKKKKYIMPCLAHFYKEPRQFVKGEMQYLFDSEGRKYLDCFAVICSNCGVITCRCHCHDEKVIHDDQLARTLWSIFYKGGNNNERKNKL